MRNQPARAVIFIVNGLGDHLMMLPVVRALSHVFGGRIVIAALPTTQIVFAEVAIKRFVPLRLSAARGPRAVDIEDAIARIGQADVLVSLNRTNDDDVRRLVEGIGASVTAGLFPDFTIHVSFDHEMHCTDLAFQLARQFDDTLDIEVFSRPPALSADAARRGRQFAELLPPGMQTLIVHADTSSEKEWAVARFQRTLGAFLSAHSNFLCLVLGSRDVGIQSGPRTRIFSAVGLPLEVRSPWWAAAPRSLASIPPCCTPPICSGCHPLCWSARVTPDSSAADSVATST